MNNISKEKYGPWALITGATSGIGAEFAKHVAQKGLNLVLVSRQQDAVKLKANELSAAYGIEVKTIVTDLSKAEGPQNVIKETDGMEIGLFIPCAGMETHGSIRNIDIQQELDMIALNVTSVFTLTHHYIELMGRRGKGGILFVASMFGNMPSPYYSNYAATKAYVYNLGTSLYGEMKSKGVDITVLSPGLTKTPMTMEMEGIDLNKTIMSSMDPSRTAAIGLSALGKKPFVVPGFRNNIMMFMTRFLSPLKMVIGMNKIMIERASKGSYLKSL